MPICRTNRAAFRLKLIGDGYGLRMNLTRGRSSPPSKRLVNTSNSMNQESTTRTGRFKLRTSALRAYTMLLALIVIWLFFQWATIDPEYHPYGLFLGAVNFSKLLQQMAVTGVL